MGVSTQNIRVDKLHVEGQTKKVTFERRSERIWRVKSFLRREINGLSLKLSAVL